MDTITCQFTLSPMSDRFIPIILDAVAQVDTTGITAHTGKMCTQYTGPAGLVLAALQNCFCAAVTTGVHMTMQAALTGEGGLLGPCPAPRYIGPAGQLGLCQLAAYLPAGVALAGEKLAAVQTSPQPYGALLEGPLPALFAALTEAVENLAAAGPFALTAAFSVNSPTPG